MELWIRLAPTKRHKDEWKHNRGITRCKQGWNRGGFRLLEGIWPQGQRNAGCAGKADWQICPTSPVANSPGRIPANRE
jgi:uncharacterized protein HemY